MLTRIHITFTKVPAMSTLTSIHRDATCATSHRPSLLGRLRNMLSLRAQRHALAQLDDRALDDIGLSRDTALSEARRPVWDVPHTWLR